MLMLIIYYMHLFLGWVSWTLLLVKINNSNYWSQYVNDIFKMKHLTKLFIFFPLAFYAMRNYGWDCFSVSMKNGNSIMSLNRFPKRIFCKIVM